jgi:hypothetical protein
MSSVEFGAWVEFYAVEPFGPFHDDKRSARQAAASLNAMGAKVNPEELMDSVGVERVSPGDTRQQDLDAYIIARCPAMM